MEMLDDLKSQFVKHLPREIVDQLFIEYVKLKDNFLLGKYEPSELNAGKFSEVAFRVLEYETSGRTSYTPFGVPLKRIDLLIADFAQLPRTINDTLRLHIPRALFALYNIRNHRGVGHLSGEVNPNVADASFLNAGCDWVMAEFVRLFYEGDIAKAEAIVKRIVRRKISIVYSIGARKRVLKTKGFDKKVLVLLLEEYPGSISDSDLFKWTEHTNITVFRASLVKLHKADLIDYHKGICVLTPIGIGVAEEFLLNNS